MPGEVLVALAQWAGQTVAAAAVSDVWESARGKFARLLGRGDGRKTEVAQRWEGRFADLLDADPAAEADLRALVQEIRAALPARVVSAADHGVAAGRDVN